LTQALKDKKTPAQLVQMPPVYVQRRRTASDVRDGRGHSFVQSFHDKIPFFSWCWIKHNTNAGTLNSSVVAWSRECGMNECLWWKKSVIIRCFFCCRKSSL